MRHQKDVATVAGGVTSVVAAVALGADPAAIGTWFWGVIDGVIGRIQAGYALNRASSTAYLHRHARLHGRSVVPQGGFLDVARLRKRLEIVGPIGFKSGIAAGQDTDTAIRNMATQMSGVAAEAVRNGDRDVITQTAFNGQGVVGWRRRLGGRGCGFCAQLASRGAVYVSRRTAGLDRSGERYHPHCRCWPEPLYDRHDEPPEVRDLQRQWRDVTAGKSGREKRIAWRQHWEHATPRARQRMGLPSKPSGAAGTPGAQAQVRQLLLDARSPEQVSQTLAAELKRVTGRDIRVDLRGSVDTAREHAEGVLRVAERYPDVAVNEVVTDRLLLAYAEWDDGRLIFSDRYSSLDRRGRYLSELAGDADAKWHPYSDPVGMAVHEMGHALDVGTLNRSIRTQLDEIMSSSDAGRVSGYAAQNVDEFVAEAFADVLMNGPRAHALSRQVVELLDDAYRVRGVGGSGRLRTVPDVSRMTVPQLKELAKDRGIPGYSRMRKPELLEALGAPAPAHVAKKAAKKAAAPAKAAKRAPAARADLTGARGLSDVPAVRAVQVENRIREAFGGMRQAPGGWVGLAELRAQLNMAGLTRAEVDDALRRLARQPGVRVAPFDNTRALRQVDRDAALALGDSPKHMIAFGATDTVPSLRQLPAKAAPAKKAAKKAAAPAKAAKRAPARGQGALSAGQADLSIGSAARRRLSLPETRALGEYQGDARRINALLREGRAPNAIIETLDRVIQRSQVSTDVELWRGIRSGRGIFGDSLDGDLAGFQWTEAAYLSTSANRGVAAQFVAAAPGDSPVIMRVVAPRGTNAVTVSRWDSGVAAVGDQAEVLLPRGRSLRVVADHGFDADGIRRIDVEILPATPAKAAKKAAAPAKVTGPPAPARMTTTALRTELERAGVTVPARLPKATLADEVTALRGGASVDEIGARLNPPRAQVIDRTQPPAAILEQETRARTAALAAPPVKLQQLRGADAAALKYYQRHGDAHMLGLMRRGRVGSAPGFKGTPPTVEQVWESIDHIRRLMDRSALTEPVVVYRGMAGFRRVFRDAGEPGSLVGRTFRDKGFVSTSADRRLAMDFMAGEGWASDGVLLEIRVPHGVKALQISNDDYAGIAPTNAGVSEREILLQDGLRFRVVSDEMVDDVFHYPGGARTGDPYRHVVVEVIP